MLSVCFLFCSHKLNNHQKEDNAEVVKDEAHQDDLIPPDANDRDGDHAGERDEDQVEEQDEDQVDEVDDEIGPLDDHAGEQLNEGNDAPVRNLGGLQAPGMSAEKQHLEGGPGEQLLDQQQENEEKNKDWPQVPEAPAFNADQNVAAPDPQVGGLAPPP